MKGYYRFQIFNKFFPRTAIEAEILCAARVMQVRFLKRLSNLYILVQV